MLQDLIRISLMAILLLTSVAAGPASDEENLDLFLDGIIKRLEEKDIAGYLALLIPDLRDSENAAVRSYFDVFEMDRLTLRKSGRGSDESGRPVVFLQAFFQNEHAVIAENWKFFLERLDGRWRIVRREPSGSVANLYKLQIPSGRYGRSSRVEIEHRDIKIVFEEAVVFFDNIPHLETALVVLGKGHVTFRPSDDIEKHQLELIYGRPLLEDTLDHVFLRCSNHFFLTRVTIRDFVDDPRVAVTESEKKSAAAVFSRNYGRSFTIESPMDQGLLSFLPQGDEAVFDFRGRKTGQMTYIYHPFSEEEISLFDRSKNRIVNMYSPRRADEERLPRMFVSFGEKFDVRHYDLDVDYNPESSFLSAKARIRIASRVEALDAVKFRLNPDLEILKVRDPAGRDLFVTQDRLRNLFYAYFIVPPERGEIFELEIEYRGRIFPIPPMSDVLSQSGVRDQVVAFRPRYETYLFTHNALWYPAPPDEKYFTARMRIVVPPGYVCLSVGNPAGSNGSSSFLWETRTPVKYLAFIVGRFDKTQSRDLPVPFSVHVSSEISVPWRELAEKSSEILEFYSGLFGPFPYDSFRVVHRLWPVRGGHSPPSFIVLNEPPWIGERRYGLALNSPVDISARVEYLLAHEIAHQWWGQAVSWATYRDQWLSEGLSQYAAVLYLRKQFGEREFAGILKKLSRWTEQKSHRGPVILGSRLSYTDYEAFQAIVYNKASLALHMLSDLLGEDLFYRCLREFFREHRHGRARTGQFIQAVEKTSGRDLQDFFQGWFFRHELPRVRFSSQVEKTENGFRTRIRVFQPHNVFVFPLWVEWRIGRTSHRAMIVVDGPQVEAVWETEERPRRIRINPDGLVPGKFQKL
jgi:hypothetical protein